MIWGTTKIHIFYQFIFKYLNEISAQPSILTHFHLLPTPASRSHEAPKGWSLAHVYCSIFLKMSAYLAREGVWRYFLSHPGLETATTALWASAQLEWPYENLWNRRLFVCLARQYFRFCLAANYLSANFPKNSRRSKPTSCWKFVR